MSCRLIVHADDFGISEQVNDGVCLAHQEGILTSTSIMASGVAFEHGVDLLKNNPSLDVGIHLTLIEELPLLPKQMISSIVGENGLFFNHATTFIKMYLTGRVELSQVRKELEQQIRKVLDTGISISHLDSHQHIHALPGIRSTVVELAEKFGIPGIRLPSERFQRYMFRDIGGISRLGQLLVLKTFCGIGHWSRVKSPDYFVGFYFGGKVTYRNLKTIVNSLPAEGTCELMCHPGVPEEESRYTHWGYRQSDELEALLDPGAALLLKENDVTLISYKELTE